MSDAINDIELSNVVLTVAGILGSWLLITKQGRAKLKELKDKFGWMKFLLIAAVIVVPIAVYAGYIHWTMQSTDPDVLGRQPDRPAPLNTPISIDDMTVTVTRSSAEVSHRQLGGTGTYMTITIRFSVSCDKAPGEHCGTRTSYEIVLPEGNGFIKKTENLWGDTDAIKAGLQGGESVELILSTNPQPSKRKLSGASIIFGGPGGRPNSPHRAYFAPEF